MLVYYVNKDEIEWYFEHDPRLKGLQRPSVAKL